MRSSSSHWRILSIAGIVFGIAAFGLPISWTSVVAQVDSPQPDLTAIQILPQAAGFLTINRKTGEIWEYTQESGNEQSHFQRSWSRPDMHARFVKAGEPLQVLP
jgi:hypothetical protein